MCLMKYIVCVTQDLQKYQIVLKKIYNKPNQIYEHWIRPFDRYFKDDLCESPITVHEKNYNELSYKEKTRVVIYVSDMK